MQRYCPNTENLNANSKGTWKHQPSIEDPSISQWIEILQMWTKNEKNERVKVVFFRKGSEYRATLKKHFL